MSWKIKPTPGGFDIENHHKERVGNISANGNLWDVSFKDAPKLDGKNFTSHEQAVGFVRGIEKAVMVHGEEGARACVCKMPYWL